MPRKTAKPSVGPCKKTGASTLHPARTVPELVRKGFRPATGSDADWDAAYYRLEDYFRSLHVIDKIHQSQLVLSLLRTAAARHAVNPDLNPTALAMEALQHAMDGWFRRVLAEEDPFSRQGRLALLITGGAERWPTVFLTGQIPPEFRQALQEGKVQAGPDLQISSMVPRPLDDSLLLELELPVAWPRRFSFPALFTVVLLVTAIFFLIFTGVP